MDLLLILTYAAICVVIFKIFRIPINKWTVPTAVLGGIAIVSLLIFGMNYNHPFSERSLQYFVTTPIIPNVSGQVIAVPVQNNMPLKKGDILLQIDPVPFQNKVNSLQAQLLMADADLKRSIELVAKNALPLRERELAESRVTQLKADLETAKYELEQTTIRAPGTGYVTQVAARPGTRAVTLPFRPMMVFIPQESNYLVGWFRQNSLLRLKSGSPAEVIFDGIPGIIFSGKVKFVVPVLAEGQISPSGDLIDDDQARYPGRIPVTIEITDPNFVKYMHTLPGGSYGQCTIYTEHAKHLSIIRKVLIRMAAWMNYLFPIH